MENIQPKIVTLAEYRARRDRARRDARPHDGRAQYYCLRCDGDEFRLYASGMVHCSHCGSMMRNLLINGSKAEDTPQ